MNGKIKLYGRARRLALARIVVAVVLGIILIVFVLISIFGKKEEVIVNKDFSFLTNYFVDRHYSCEVLKESGNKCVLFSDNLKKSFYRHDDGFQFIINSDSYTLSITHRLSESDSIIFKTNSNAFSGYKNQEFICEFDKSVLDSVKKCISKEVDLDIPSYLGLIEDAQLEVNNALLSSGYSYEGVMINYVWKEK